MNIIKLDKLDKYINLPYKNVGRDFNGVDCFGLVYLIYKNELNIELPDFTNLMYSKNWFKEGKNIIVENVWDKWYEVDKTEQTDLLLFYTNYKKRVVNHIGLYIGNNKFIHILETYSSKIDRLDGRWNKLLYKILRYGVK